MAQSGDTYIYPESETVLKQNLIAISRNKILAAQIDKFYHEEMANSNLPLEVIEIVDGYYQCIQGFLEISNPPPENPLEKKEGVKYWDYTPVIMRLYSRAKNLTILYKSYKGFAAKTVTENRSASVQEMRDGKAYDYDEDDVFFGGRSPPRNEPKKKGWLPW